MGYTIKAGELSIAVEPMTARLSFAWRGKEITGTRSAPVLRLAGKEVAVKQVEALDGGVRARLEGGGVSGSWRLRPADGAISSLIDVDGAVADQAVEIEIPFPLSAALELPTDQMRGWRFDSSWPVGREEGVDLSGTKNQLAAVEVGGAALGFVGTADYTRHMPRTYGGVWKVGAYRDGDCLWLRLAMPNGVPMEMSCHDDLEGVIDRYCRVVRRDLGLLTIAEDPSIPDWYHDIKVFVTVPMTACNGTIINDFGNVVSFCKDLEDLGVAGGVVVRFVGFQGRFDSRYPYFDPAPELGGAAGMRAAVDAVHAGGNRVTAHFNIWGLDPYLENFEELEHLAVPYDRCYERIPTGQIGPYDGWPGPYPAQRADFETGLQPIEPLEVDDSHMVFETADIPRDCEAMLSLHGVRDFAGGRLRAEVDERQVKSLPGWFEHTDRVQFRFRFRFYPGRNRVRLDYLGGTPDMSGARYRVHNPVVATQVWSYPILRADITHPEWIDLTRDNLVRVSREYDLDIPHIDAVNIWRAETRPIFQMVKDELPGRVFGCEYSAELGYNMFRLTHVGRLSEPWPRTSDFATRVHRRFTRFFNCGHFLVPSRELFWWAGRTGATEEEKREAAELHLRECPGQQVFPSVRLNHPEHGLDERARQVILDACKG